MQGKWKAKMFPKRKDPREGGYYGNCPRREFSNETSPLRTWLIHCLKNQYITYWRKLRMSLISNGPIRWAGTRPEETKASIAITTKTERILWRIAKPCKITWASW